jgi:hypothetical protein
MKMIIPLLTALSLASAVHGATIVQTKTFSFVPDGSANLVFDQFDSSLGTLTSIVITTNITKSGGSLFVDNDSETPASGNISQSVTISLSSGDVVLTDTSLQPIGNNLTATSFYFATVGADDGDGPGVQTDGLDYDGTVFANVSNSTSGTVNSAGEAGYIGTGTFQINAGGTQGFNTSAIGGAAVVIDPASVSGDVTITYNYEAIPEPASAIFGALGLLTLLRRRR